MTSSKLLALPLIAIAAGACAGGSAASRPAAQPKAEAPAAAAAPAGKAGSGRELSPRAQRLFDEAVAAAEEQKKLKVPTDWELLERRWRAVVEAEPVPEAWFNLGVILEKRRELDDARAAYRKALSLEPEFAPAAVNLALLEEPRDPGQAAAAWQAVLRRFPQDPIPRVRLAALYLATGQLDEARKLAREALVRDPRAIGAYAVMMRVALQRGQLDLAQLLAVRAQKIDDSDPDVAAALGDVLLARHDEAGAMGSGRRRLAARRLPPCALFLLAGARCKWRAPSRPARSGRNPKEARQLALDRLPVPQPEGLAAYEQAEKLAADSSEVHLARAASHEDEGAVRAGARRDPTLSPWARGRDDGLRPAERECARLAASKQAEEAARDEGRAERCGEEGRCHQGGAP
jgi:tetratricopeptide (TPR) repeat protein